MYIKVMPMYTVEIPENVDVVIEWPKVIVKGPRGTLERTFNNIGISVKKEENKIIVEPIKKRRKFKANAGTVAAHIRNMILGVTKGWKYILEIYYKHFPIKVEIKGNEIHILNYLGEKTPRITYKYPDVDVKINGNTIIVEGNNLEHVAQTAANLRNITKPRRLDPRKFQDGIYILERKLHIDG